MPTNSLHHTRGSISTCPGAGRWTECSRTALRRIVPSRATSTPFVLDVPTSTPRTAFTPVAIWCHRSCHGLALERGVPRNCLILPCRGHLPVGSRSRSGHLVGALPAPCRTPARHDRSERVFATLSPSRFLSIGSGCAHEGDAAGGTATPNATEGTACSRALSTCSFCTGRP